MDVVRLAVTIGDYCCVGYHTLVLVDVLRDLHQSMQRPNLLRWCHLCGEQGAVPSSLGRANIGGVDSAALSWSQRLFVDALSPRV